ncbi:MAG: hypothetical protein ACXWWI_09815, partial [Nitrospira sp.]
REEREVQDSYNHTLPYADLDCESYRSALCFVAEPCRMLARSGDRGLNRDAVAIKVHLGA